MILAKISIDIYALLEVSLPDSVSRPEKGIVIRSHAGGYLVHVQSERFPTGQILLCQARGRLKKERKAIYTGEEVELDEIDPVENAAVITALMPRRTMIARPTLANVDQVVIVQAVKQPEFDQLWTDRYLVFFSLALDTIRPLLCFNKCDLVPPEELDRLRKIYEPLGYFVIFVSAKTLEGLDNLRAAISGKTSVFAGPSGVGKSSLLNELMPGIDIRVGRMENDFGVGRHTTTASELYQVPDRDGVLTWIADTPGFNLYEFGHPNPPELAFQFPEFLDLAQKCRFANCLHSVEAGCAILEKIEGILAEPEEGSPESEADEEPRNISEEDRNFIARYQSYCVMLAESQEAQEQQKTVSRKIESSNKSTPRLSSKHRASARNTQKQKLRPEDIPEEEEEEEDAEDTFE